MDRTLYNQLLPVVRRFRFRRTLLAVSLIWFLGAACAGFAVYLNRFGIIEGRRAVLPILIATSVISLIAAWWAARTSKTPAQIAEFIEKQYPELDSALITAIEQERKEGERLGFLQQETMRKAVAHSFHETWPSAVPGWQLFATPLVTTVAFITLIICLFGLQTQSKEIPEDPTISFQDAAIINRDFEVSVEPGDTEIERGTSLLVLARFNQHLPPETNLIFSNEDGSESTLPMTKSLDDPVFGARIPSVQHPLTYRVEFSEQQSKSYSVEVFEFPELVRADAKLTFPTYTQKSEKRVQDFRRVNAVQGTKLEISFFVNQPLVSAILEPVGTDESDNGSSPISLVPSDTDPKKLSAQWVMDESEKFELILVDEADRKNRTPPRFVFNVVANKPPKLKLANSKDIQASPLEELDIKATASDDFGLTALGFSYVVAGQPEQSIRLDHESQNQKTAKSKKKQPVGHLLELEELDVQPDDLVTYYFWAEDIGPEGEPRRVASDMFFAEIRHFEEIYRQGAAQPAGQQPQPGEQNGQNGQQSQQLAELQKEIINATWKVIRRETKDELTPIFEEDIDTLIESQQTAIEQAEALKAELDDTDSATFLDEARSLMGEAVSNLSQAKRESDTSALQTAMTSERSAYKALLKLRAKEHEVTRQNQPQMGQAGQQNNRQQEQLDQLNLKEDENRYETERLAQEQSEQQQQKQEERQVLSRLRELARRQADLNERIKELQNALEEAKTEEEQEDIKKRLKSLREQQQQMLRDTEELLERMQQEQNSSNMQEESEQLEQTRENLQRASEALEQNQVSRAAAEGTRAQRDLEDLRDEFQERTAGQFSEEMRQLRNEAQKIEEDQNKIAERLSDQPKTEEQNGERKSLRDQNDEPDLRDQLADQKQAVEALRDAMRKTIEEAETLEPLLAEDLYETYRDSEVSRPDRALDSARRSLSRGWMDDARNEEERARQGIEEIREGIENAAESILGDETQALKTARDSLEELNRQLQNEIDEKNPEKDSQGSSENESDEPPSQNSSSSSQRGKNSSDDQNRSNLELAEQAELAENQNGSSSPGRQSTEEPQEDSATPGASDQNQPPQAKPNPSSGGGRSSEQTESTESSEPNEGNENQGERSDGNSVGGGQRPEDDRDSIRDQIRRLGNQNPETDDELTLNRGGGNLRMMQPISGDDFRDWSDLLRDVEEMVPDPELRAEASRIREKAREIRKEMKERHSAEPNWDLVKLKVAKPLAELQDRVIEEIMRRSSKKLLVPLDRDPVPAEYRDAVRKYYESLGRGE